MLDERIGQYQIAVDIGGTFTDGVLMAPLERFAGAGARGGSGGSAGRIFRAKSLTTPDDPGAAVSEVVAALLGETGQAHGKVLRVVHGTTLVTNTLVQQRGARAALVLTRGTRDCLDIRRELRYDIYDLMAEYPAALVPLEDRFELSERLSSEGEVLEPLDPDELSELAEALSTRGYEAVAVCLLNSPVNDAHERAVGSALEKALLGTPVSLSHEVAREIGEFERMSTVVANACVQPVTARYLASLEGRLERSGAWPDAPSRKPAPPSGTLDIMLSNGAFTGAAIAARFPIRILESGPAGGVLAAVNCAREAGIERVLAFDMGGTTAKACVAVAGEAALTHVFEFGRVRRFKRGSGLPAVAPSVDLIEIGAGGGSLARPSPLGLLQVGPQSAGAVPGPACYGQGGREATVTDADLLLGYLDAETFLGGRMHLDVERARQAVRAAGERLGLDPVRSAWGIHDIVNENMASAARTHIAEKGFDARDFTLVATGGAGPVHAVDVARRLRISRVLCPIASGVGSCLGFLAAPARADRTWSKIEAVAELDLGALSDRLARACEEIGRDLEQCGLPPEAVVWWLSAEIRYLGQGDTLEVGILQGPSPETVRLDRGVLIERFEQEYERLYRKTVPGGTPEVVTWRVSGASASATVHFRLAEAGQEPAVPAPAEGRRRRIYRPDTGGFEEVPVHERYALPAGVELASPLVLTEPESTLVVAYPGRVRVLESGTVEVVIGESKE